MRKTICGLLVACLLVASPVGAQYPGGTGGSGPGGSQPGMPPADDGVDVAGLAGLGTPVLWPDGTVGWVYQGVPTDFDPSLTFSVAPTEPVYLIGDDPDPSQDPFPGSRYDAPISRGQIKLNGGTASLSIFPNGHMLKGLGNPRFYVLLALTPNPVTVGLMRGTFGTLCVSYWQPMQPSLYPKVIWVVPIANSQTTAQYTFTTKNLSVPPGSVISANFSGTGFGTQGVWYVPQVIDFALATW